MQKDEGVGEQSIKKSYHRLRYMAGAALIGMPLLTALVGILAGHMLQDSLSDYYFVVKDGGLPRTLFVMFLAFLGGVLFSYRGLDDTDNKIHNIAGIFAFGVALFPMQCSISEHPYCVPGLLPVLHLPSAGLLYIAALISVLYGGGPKLKSAIQRLPDPQVWFRKLRNIKSLSAVLMTIGIITFLFHKMLKAYFPEFSWIFWIEYTGFLGFGIYWVRLMVFINAVNKAGHEMVSERSALGEVIEAPEQIQGIVRQPPPMEEWQDIP